MDSSSLPAQLSDTFGRRFEYLRLSITDVCNFKCQYCLPDGYECNTPTDFLSLEEISTTVNAFALMGTKKVRITGGEPALRKDLLDIIKLVASVEKIQQVAITTNGYNLDRQVEKWADAGLTNLNVSIDSLDATQFKLITGDGRLQNILTGIEKAIDLGLNVKVNAVLLKSFTQKQLNQFLYWIKDKSISMRFIELMQTGDNLSFFEREHFSGESVKQVLLSQKWTEKPRDQLSGPAKIFTHPEYKGNIGLIMPYSKNFCDNCNRLRISAIGKLHLCLFAENGIDLRSTMKTKNAFLLASEIAGCLSDKQKTHDLLEGNTGATTHLAMLGG